MTRLHLLRHAHAGDSAEWDGPDATRPLTDKGRAQADALGRFLRAGRLQTDAVLTSPKVRAAQTAELVAGHLGVPVVVEPRLGGPLDLGLLDAILGDHADPQRPILVGHDPDLSEVVAELIGSDAVPMRKGACIRIDAERPFAAEGGTLRWLIPPEVLPDAG